MIQCRRAQISGEVGGSWGCIVLPLWLSDVLRLGVVSTALMQTVRFSTSLLCELTPRSWVLLKRACNADGTSRRRNLSHVLTCRSDAGRRVALLLATVHSVRVCMHAEVHGVC